MTIAEKIISEFTVNTRIENYKSFENAISIGREEQDYDQGLTTIYFDDNSVIIWEGVYAHFM